MSSVEFECQFNPVDNPSIESFSQALKHFCQGDKAACVSAFTQIGVQPNLLDDLNSSHMTICQDNPVVIVNMSVGSAIELSFFERFIAVLVLLQASDYQARLFDSSSGGTQVWSSPSNEILEIELDGKQVVIVGETGEPLAEIEALLEDYDAAIQGQIDQNTDIIIVGDEADVKQWQQQHPDIQVMSETDFWDFIEQAPG